MNPSVLSTVFAALTLGVLATGCQHSTSPQYLSTVDSLITTTNGALLTLRELDPARYDHLDSLHHQLLPSFLDRFDDTLPPDRADLLADRFLVLRAAARMGSDQRSLEQRLAYRVARLDTLRSDLAVGALAEGEVRSAVQAEQRWADFDHAQVLNVLDNYRMAQQAWEQRDTVLTLLADTPSSRPRP
jgi:hypothetical protein